MRTLPDNYARNVEIMRKNIHRGLTEAQALQVVNRFEKQFKSAKLYGEAERAFIEAMRDEVAKGFGGSISASDAMSKLGVEVVRVA